MIIFVRGRAVSLNNNKENGIQFFEGRLQPILGKFVTKLQSFWKIYIG